MFEFLTVAIGFLAGMTASVAGFGIGTFLTPIVSVTTGAKVANLGRANPLPELYQELTIVNRHNGTTNENTIVVNFALESQNFFQWRNFSYSLDGKEQKAVR